MKIRQLRIPRLCVPVVEVDPNRDVDAERKAKQIPEQVRISTEEGLGPDGPPRVSVELSRAKAGGVVEEQRAIGPGDHKGTGIPLVVIRPRAVEGEVRRQVSDGHGGRSVVFILRIRGVVLGDRRTGHRNEEEAEKKHSEKALRDYDASVSMGHRLYDSLSVSAK